LSGSVFRINSPEMKTRALDVPHLLGWGGVLGSASRQVLSALIDMLAISSRSGGMCPRQQGGVTCDRKDYSDGIL